jgi:hypothetical protein
MMMEATALVIFSAILYFLYALSKQLEYMREDMSLHFRNEDANHRRLIEELEKFLADAKPQKEEVPIAPVSRQPARKSRQQKYIRPASRELVRPYRDKNGRPITEKQMLMYKNLSEKAREMNQKKRAEQSARPVHQKETLDI